MMARIDKDRLLPLLLGLICLFGKCHSDSSGSYGPQHAGNSQGNADVAMATASNALMMAETTTSPNWGKQITPPPQLCWNTTRMMRPQSKITPLAEFPNTELINCQTFCEKKYDGCAMLSYRHDSMLCRLYGNGLTYLNMSLDLDYIMQTPMDCVHEFWYFSTSETYSTAKSFCEGQNGRLASIMNDNDMESIISRLPSGVSEAWIGVRITDGSWLWENGQLATVQRFFRDSVFSNTKDDDVCGKVVVQNVTDKIRKLFVRRETCSTPLPVICQFGQGVLTTTTEPLPTDEPFIKNDINRLYVLVTSQPPAVQTAKATAKSITPTKSITGMTTKATTTTPKPEVTTKVPGPKTAPPPSKDPVEISIASSMSFIVVVFIAIIVVLDLATLSKEIDRLKVNLKQFWNECWHGDDGTFDPPPEITIAPRRKQIDSEDVPDWRIPVSQYRDYDQMFQAV